MNKEHARKLLLHWHEMSNMLTHFPEPMTTILKINYLSKAKFIEKTEHVSLDTKFKNYNLKCPRCNLEVSPENTHSLVSAKNNKFIRRLRKKVINGAYTTAYQKRYLKKYIDPENYTTVLNIKCNVCGKIMKKPLKKLKKEISIIEIEEIQTIPKKSSKKKKTDRFSGLNISAVLAAKKNEETPDSNKVINTITTPKTELPIKQIKDKTTKSGNNETKKEILPQKSKTQQIKQNKLNLKKLGGILNSVKKTSTPKCALKNFLQNL